MRNFYLKIWKLFKDNQDSIIISSIIIFFVWKFIFFPDFFQAAFIYIKNNLVLIYETIKNFFKK